MDVTTDEPAARRPLDPRALRALVEAAVLAPSSHNTQPWRFALRARAIDLLADRLRALPVNDPDDRELAISCGAALENLAVAASAAGLSPRVELCPGEPDLLARVRLEDGAAPDEDASRLAAAIPRRRTYRGPFEDRAVAEELGAALERAAEERGCRLRVARGDEERLAVVELVERGDRQLWSDPRWRRELAAWMHPRRRGDGLTVPALATPLAQLIVRTFDLGGGVAARDRDIAKGSPLLAVLVSRGDTEEDWVQAGRALERVLLRAVTLGLQASYLDQPVQVAALRGELAAALRVDGAPQLVLRLGHPRESLAATPRRPLDDVLEPASGAGAPLAEQSVPEARR